MAWSISISAEGWAEIMEALHAWDKERLINAITDDYYEQLEQQGKDPETCKRRAAKRKYYYQQYASQEALADHCFQLIENNATCDNGGNGFYIDREGYHQVYI